MNKIAAKLTTMVHMAKEAKDDERGDIVQTLIIVAVSVALGALVVPFLWGMVEGYINNINSNIDGTVK